MKKTQSGFGVLAVLAIIVVAGVIGFAAWRVMDKPRQAQHTNTEADKGVSNKDIVSKTKGKTYANTAYHISFTYPAGWSVKTLEASSYSVLSVNFDSPDFVKRNLDNGYSIDTGGEFHLEISPVDGSAGMDPAYTEAAQHYLQKSSIDTTAEFIRLLQADAIGQSGYNSPEVIDGVAAGRGTFGDYVHGPQVFWVKDHLLYTVYYDGARTGTDVGEYNAEFESLLKSIVLK